MRLQVASTGEKAKGPTAEEFLKEVISEAKKAAEEKGIRNPIFAFDNASIHELAKGALPASQVLKVPKWSPDFMKVIEHNHAYVVDRFERYLAKKRNIKQPPSMFHNLLINCFRDATTKQVVSRDLRGLWPMLRATITVDGDYASRNLR